MMRDYETSKRSKRQMMFNNHTMDPRTQHPTDSELEAEIAWYYSAMRTRIASCSSDLGHLLAQVESRRMELGRRRQIRYSQEEQAESDGRRGRMVWSRIGTISGGPSVRKTDPFVHLERGDGER